MLNKKVIDNLRWGGYLGACRKEKQEKTQPIAEV